MKSNLYVIVIIIIILVLVIHIYNVETPEQFYIQETFISDIPTNTTDNILLKQDINTTVVPNIINVSSGNVLNEQLSNEKELLELKKKTIQRLTDKLKAVNIKMAEFEKIKPVKSNVYTNLFENQLPSYFKKHRSDSNLTNIYYDISQDIQDKRLENLETKFSQIKENAKDIEPDKIVSNLGSVKSHLYGKTLNLINNPNNTYTIPINNGCLFVVDDGSGKVDYDITNFTRNDKNKICLPEAPSQQFILTKINDLDGYKKITGVNINEEPIDSEYITYPFYVIQPSGKNTHCLEIGHDGVHFEKCNNKKSQRWEGSNKSKSCGCNTK